MRMGFGLIGLLLALAIVGIVVKKQMAATKVFVPAGVSAPANGNASASAPGNVREQAQQIEQQYKQQLDAAMQQQQQRLEREAQ